MGTDDEFLLLLRYEQIKDALKELTKQIDKRLPLYGSRNHFFAAAHFLHPCFKGAALKHERLIDPETRVTKFDEVRRKIVEDHPTTEAHRVASRENPLDVAFLAAAEQDPFLQYVRDQLTPNPGATAEDLAAESPIEMELKMFLASRPALPNVNILQWWLEHKEQYPLLFEVAR